MIAEAFFWTSAGTLVYAYAGFPAALYLLDKSFGDDPAPAGPAEQPIVTVIVAAFNEARTIRSKIENLFAQIYPADRLEVIVASDGSTDGTSETARSFGEARLRVLDFKVNRGRAAVHNAAVLEARGDILLFTDAETSFAPDFIHAVSRRLSDPAFGCGSGDYSFLPMGAVGASESLYWRMEKWTRKLEFRLGILPFASGGCLAIRRELYEDIPDDTDIDTELPFRTVEKGLKIFYAEEAKAFDVTAADPASQYRKRTRTALKALPGIVSASSRLLATGRWAAFAVLFSQRLLRWLGAYLMVIGLLSNAWLARSGNPVYRALLATQVVFFCLAFAGWLDEQGLKSLPDRPARCARAAYAFVLANAAFIHGTASWTAGKRIAGYRPASHA